MYIYRENVTSERSDLITASLILAIYIYRNISYIAISRVSMIHEIPTRQTAKLGHTVSMSCKTLAQWFSGYIK